MKPTYLTKISTLAGAAAVMAAVGVSAPAHAQLKSITIGTNPAGTTYNVLGGIFAKTFQQKLKVRSTAQPHAGSSVYLPLMDKGEITMGLNSSLDSALAFAGKAPYKSATKNVRSVARIWQLPYGYFARKDSGIKNIADLKGKRVVVTLKSNVSLAQLNKTIMGTAGLGAGDYTEVVAGNIPQNINLVVEGRADAAVTAMGIPLIRKANAGIPGGVRVLGLGSKGTDDYMSANTPGSRTITVNPSKRNVGVLEPTKIAVFDTFFNISGNVSDDDAYKITKTVVESWAEFGKQHPIFRGLKPNQLSPATNPIPYHPGAIKYYKEAGLWTADNDKHRMMITK